MALYPLSQSAVFHRRNTYAPLERVVEAGQNQRLTELTGYNGHAGEM